MQRWWQIATRNWRTRPARSALAVLAVTLGVGVVVWVTCCYESVRRGVTEVVLQWIGRSHVIVESTAGVWGLIDIRIAEAVKDVPNIARTTLRTREYVDAAPPSPGDATLPDLERSKRIEVMGVLPDREREFQTYELTEGRFIAPGTIGEALAERLLAKQLGLKLGDDVYLRYGNDGEFRRYRVVGIAERRRASLNQALMVWTSLADVQALTRLPDKAKSLEIILKQHDNQSIRAAAAAVTEALQKHHAANPDVKIDDLEVKTTEAQMQKLSAAQGLLQFIMLLLSSVVLLTAFFIILATMGMGVTEQIAQLGLLRCIGVTRQQIAKLVILQTAPFGVAGVVFGVPLGLLLQLVTIQLVPDYLGQFAVNRPGMALAVVGGLLTTLLGAALPAVRAMHVTPVEAVRAPADPRVMSFAWLAAGLGVALIALHAFLLSSIAGRGEPGFDAPAIASVVLLYLGAALLAPLLVRLTGGLFARVAGGVLRLRPELLGEEIEKAPFRAGAVCSGLMVALSLIVGLVVWGESVKQGWQFPQEFPDALLYSYEDIPIERMKSLRDIPGIKEFTVTGDFPFTMRDPNRGGFFSSLSGLDLFSRFLAIDPDEGFKIVRLVFLEGTEAEARRKLMEGGHLLVTREFAHKHKKGVGDRVRIWVQKKDKKHQRADFTIAGVVTSPGLDIAISFFNAGTHFQTYAVGAIIGTLADADRLFGLGYGNLILFNFDLPDDPQRERADSGEYTDDVAIGDTTLSPEGRPTFAQIGSRPLPGDDPETKIVNQMLERLNYPPRAYVTARELKKQIDRNIDRVTLLLSAIPFVGLVIAALGLGNLMAANVASRTKHLAVLRSLGLTRGQLTRLIIGEGLVLALIGTVLGIVLGVVLARASNMMTLTLSGFEPEFTIPWRLVFAGAALAALLCIAAALVPARRASRTNIVAALTDL